MNKYQKELIAKCEPYIDGMPFDSFYVISSGKLYNGTWGKNGFNNIYLVCYNEEFKKYYIVGQSYQSDVVSLGNYGGIIHNLSIEIPQKLNAIHIWGRKKLVIEDSLFSTIIIKEME